MQYSEHERERERDHICERRERDHTSERRERGTIYVRREREAKEIDDIFCFVTWKLFLYSGSRG